MIANYSGYITQWLKHLETTVSYNQPFSTRYAGLTSIQRFMQIRQGVCSIRFLSSESKLRLTYLIHTLLNDDVEEIRIKAAEVSVFVWSSSHNEQHQKSFIPTVADDVLVSQSVLATQQLEGLTETPNASECSTLVAAKILYCLLDITLESANTVSQALGAAISPNTLLFKLEKQNLYYDYPRIMELALSTCRKIVLSSFSHREATTLAAPSHSILARTNSSVTGISLDVTENTQDVCLVLQEYLIKSLSTLCSISDTFIAKRTAVGVKDSQIAGRSGTADGYLGWSTSNEEIFIMGYRIATGFQIWVTWVKGNEEKHHYRGQDFDDVETPTTSSKKMAAVKDDRMTERDVILTMVRELVRKGRQKSVELNEIWLEKFEEGLKVWNHQEPD